jgi:hypothetical protein
MTVGYFMFLSEPQDPPEYDNLNIDPSYEGDEDYDEDYDEDEVSNQTVLIAVRRDFWEENGCLDDQGGYDPLLPPGMEDFAESHYDYSGLGTREEVKALMVAAGWEEKELFGS